MKVLLRRRVEVESVRSVGRHSACGKMFSTGLALDQDFSRGELVADDHEVRRASCKHCRRNQAGHDDDCHDQDPTNLHLAHDISAHG